MRCFAIYDVPSVLDGSGPMRELLLLDHWRPVHATQAPACRGLVVKFAPYCIAVTAASESRLVDHFGGREEPLAGMFSGWEMTLATYVGDRCDLPRELVGKIGPRIPEAVALAEFGGDEQTGLAVDFSIGRHRHSPATHGLRFSLVDEAGVTLASFMAEPEGRMTLRPGQASRVG